MDEKVEEEIKEDRTAETIEPIIENNDSQVTIEIETNTNTDAQEEESSELSDAYNVTTSFKWLRKITGVDSRIRCDMFIDPPKVHLDITLSTGRHLCVDNLRQCSDESSEDAMAKSKNKTVMVRTYKGKDLIKIRSFRESRAFLVTEPESDNPISILTITQSSQMEVHNLVHDEWYFVDLSNRRNPLILIRAEDGSELGRIIGFGDFEPQSSSSGNVMILRPKLKFISDIEQGGLDTVQKSILLSIFISLGMTFDGEVKKTTDAFNLFATIFMVIMIICSFGVYRSSEAVKAHGNLILLINCAVILFVLGFLYLIRCCLR